jgi:hypothetical protein
MELYASACVLSRRDAELASTATADGLAAWEPFAARLFLQQSARRIREALRRLGHHDHAAIGDLAKRVLESSSTLTLPASATRRQGEGPCR